MAQSCGNLESLDLQITHGITLDPGGDPNGMEDAELRLPPGTIHSRNVRLGIVALHGRDPVEYLRALFRSVSFSGIRSFEIMFSSHFSHRMTWYPFPDALFVRSFTKEEDCLSQLLHLGVVSWNVMLRAPWKWHGRPNRHAETHIRLLS